MASKKFFVDVDLSKNQLLNAVLHNSGNTAAVLTLAGQIAYDATLNQVNYFDGNTVQHLIAGTEDFASNVASDVYAASVKAVYDYYNSTDGTGGAGVLGIEDAGGYFTAEQVEGALQEIGATLANINNAMQVVGTIGADGGTWSYPANAVKGDAYVVTGATVDSFVEVGVAGLYTTAGSLVVCNNTSGQTDADWFILDARREPSSTTVKGIIALATQEEVIAGTDPSKAVTSLTLKGYLENFAFASIYTALNVAAGATVTHNLGANVIAQVWLADEEITSGVALTSATNTVTVNANNLPGTVKVVVTGLAVL